MSMDQGGANIPPPFTSPWRAPLKSSQTSQRTPRKSVLWGSRTFRSTPLKTGARLSSVVSPVHQGYHLARGAKVQPSIGTSRASSDEACDEVLIGSILAFHGGSILPFVSDMDKRLINRDSGFFLGVGKGGNASCTITPEAPYVGLQAGLASGPKCPLDGVPSVLPTKYPLHHSDRSSKVWSRSHVQGHLRAQPLPEAVY